MNVQPHSSAPLKSSPASPARDGAAVEQAGSIRGRLRRTARLLRHADFQRVYKQGRRHFGAHMTVFFLCTSQACLAIPAGPRVGLTVGRVLGGAVQRNRIKRRMREAVRANLAALNADVDVVINPKKSALDADFSALRTDVARAFVVIQEKCSGKDSAADQRGGTT